MTTKNQYIFTKTTKRQTLNNDDGSETEQFAITLSPEQALEMATQLGNVAQTNGELGARVVFYTNMRENSRTGEKFPATSVLVQAKSLAQGSRGGFAKGSGGRRQYAPSTPPTPPPARGNWERKAAPPASRAQAPAPKEPAGQWVPPTSNDLEI